jgi:tetratricopeptide (TPR) repeat protein
MPQFYGTMLSYKDGIRVTTYNHAEAFYNEGVSSVEQGHLDDAVELFRKAINLEQDYFAAHCALGVVYNGLGKYQDALESLKEAIRIKSDFAEAFYYLGDAHIHLEQYQEAVESYKQAIQVNPDYAEDNARKGGRDYFVKFNGQFPQEFFF